METNTGLSSRSLQYYAIARKWASDIEFYSFELTFFQKLLDERFFTTPVPGERKQITELNSGLMIFEVDKNQLELSLANQMTYLELMLEDVVPEDVSWLAGKQVELENRVNEVFAGYKTIKKNIFALLQTTHAISAVAGKPLFPN